MKKLILIGVLLLAGCSSAITMKNPRTGETAQCGPYAVAGIAAMATPQREAQCIQDFKEQGYVRAN